MTTAIRRRRTAEERQEIEQQSLSRARSNTSWRNYAEIITGFASRGIPESEISPRDNVLTYHAWRAVGRQVRRGEKGVAVVTFVPLERTQENAAGERERVTVTRPRTAYVFHVSQTDPLS